MILLIFLWEVVTLKDVEHQWCQQNFASPESWQIGRNQNLHVSHSRNVHIFASPLEHRQLRSSYFLVSGAANHAVCCSVFQIFCIWIFWCHLHNWSWPYQWSSCENLKDCCHWQQFLQSSAAKSFTCSYNAKYVLQRKRNSVFLALKLYQSDFNTGYTVAKATNFAYYSSPEVRKAESLHEEVQLHLLQFISLFQEYSVRKHVA